MTVSFRAVGTWENGATGLTADEVVSIPVGATTGDLMILLATWKNFGITATVTGWTEVTQFADGSVVTGNGTGSMKVGAWYKEHSGSESDPTLDFSTTVNLVGEAVIIVFSRSLGAWSTPTFVTAAMTNWTTTPQTTNASSTIAIPNGSAVVGLAGIRDDSATITRSTDGITATGVVTWTGNYVEAPATHASTTTGNDMAADAGYRLVTTGHVGTTLVMEATISAAETGALLWVVINDQAGGQRTYRNPYPQLLAH